MKRLVLFAAMLLAGCLVARSQLTLGPGESYTNEFKMLFRTGRYEVAFPPLAAVNVAVDPATLQIEDALHVQMFEDLPTGTPFYQQTLMNTTNAMYYFAASQGFYWQDLQGSIRLTMVSGSVTIDSLLVQVFIPGSASTVHEFATRIYLPEGRPALRVVRSGTALEFSWPTSATNHVLETTPSVPAAQGWQSVTNTAEIVGDNYRVSVPLDPQVQSGFYRLRQAP